MLSLNTISAITENVARTLSLQIEVAGVTRGAHDGEYAEVLLTVLEGGEEDGRLLVGVNRAGRVEDVRGVIADALREHTKQRAGF